MERPVILVVEDEQDIRVLYKTILNRHFDFEIVEADSIQSTRAVLKNNSPDYVLLDLCLPDGSGCEAIQAIKENNADVKILVITAFGQCSETKQAAELGAVGVLEKPFKTAAFIEHLQMMQSKNNG